MKRKLISIAFSMLTTATLVLAQSRAYTNNNGTVIQAELISHAKGKVKLKRADGKEFEVSPSLFSDEDEAFIRKWMADNPADIQYSFRVAADKKKADGQKQDHGWKRIKNELWHYDVTIVNNTQEPISNFTVKYRLLYTNVTHGERILKEPETLGAQIVEGKIEEEGELGFNRTLQFQTSPVTIDTTDYDYHYSDNRQKDTLDGCIIRIEDQSGKAVLEWVSPDVGMKGKSWANSKPGDAAAGGGNKSVIR